LVALLQSIAVLALTSLEVGQYSGLTFRSTTELKELLLTKNSLFGYMKVAVKTWRLTHPRPQKEHEKVDRSDPPTGSPPRLSNYKLAKKLQEKDFEIELKRSF
jgi:hypothetical protein